MKPQQLYHGLYGRRDVQERDPRGFVRQVFVHAQQGADTRAVEKLHAAKIDGDGLDARLPEIPDLRLKLARGVRIQARRFHPQMERRIFEFSLNNNGHRSEHGRIRARVNTEMTSR